MDLGLRDRTYIVTGASGGLGFATARILAEEGAKLVISSRNDEAITRAAAELGENVVGISVDNADPESAERLAATAIAKWGALHGALVSVGGPHPGTALDSDEDHWRAAFESVFLGGLRIARAVARAGSAGTSIAFVLSSSVKAPLPNLAISNGLRPGLGMIAKNLADELGPNGIRVNGLLPGRIATDRVRELDQKTGDAEAARRASEKTIPLRRYGTADEFGKVAAFVLSPAASYVTGSMIAVDGGIMRAL